MAGPQEEKLRTGFYEHAQDWQKHDTDCSIWVCSLVMVHCPDYRRVMNNQLVQFGIADLLPFLIFYCFICIIVIFIFTSFVEKVIMIYKRESLAPLFILTAMFPCIYLLG